MRPFSWSWSRLKNYRACPKRHYHVDLAKDYKEAEGEQLIWGNQVHDALAKRLAKKTPLPSTMQSYEGWAAGAEAVGGKVLVENKLGMTKDFGKAGFFDDNTWFRAVVDLLVLPHPTLAITYDWKTGQVKPEMEQLALSAQVIFAHYPDVQQVGSRYVWLGDGDHTTVTYRREDMVPMWNNLWPEIKQMAEAYRTTTYPPKPSGLCKRFCPVTSCPHHGRGSF